MKKIRTLNDLVRRLALNDAEAAFRMLTEIGGMEPGRHTREPDMLDYDGDAMRPFESMSTSLEGFPLTVTEYPYGTTTASLGNSTVTLVHRKRQGSEFVDSYYVYEKALERFRATGMFGDVEDHDPDSFMELLREHGILAVNGLDVKNAWNPQYLRFLREREACAAVMDE